MKKHKKAIRENIAAAMLFLGMAMMFAVVAYYEGAKVIDARIWWLAVGGVLLIGGSVPMSGALG